MTTPEVLAAVLAGIDWRAEYEAWAIAFDATLPATDQGTPTNRSGVARLGRLRCGPAGSG